MLSQTQIIIHRALLEAVGLVRPQELYLSVVVELETVLDDDIPLAWSDQTQIVAALVVDAFISLRLLGLLFAEAEPATAACLLLRLNVTTLYYMRRGSDVRVFVVIWALR